MVVLGPARALRTHWEYYYCRNYLKSQSLSYKAVGPPWQLAQIWICSLAKFFRMSVMYSHSAENPCGLIPTYILFLINISLTTCNVLGRKSASSALELQKTTNP